VLLKFVSSQYNSVIPDSGDEPGPLSPNDPHDAEFISAVNGLLKDYIDAMDAVKLRLGLQTIMLISIRGNTYLQSSGLNKALMSENPNRCSQVISRAINLIYALSALVYPFMPSISESILKQLNAPPRAVPDVISTDILAGHTIGTPEHLFKKIEENMAEIWRQKFCGNEAPASEAAEAGKAAAGAKSKKKVAAKAPAPPLYAGPKSPEVLALETKVAEQGQVVRTLKAQTPRTPEQEGQVSAAVSVLRQLKGELELAMQKCIEENKVN